MTKPKVKKPVERKFKHGEIVGKVEDRFLLEILSRLCDAYTAAWNKVGELVGISIYDALKDNGTPRDFGISDLTGEVKYMGRTQK
jgi:hypothetical protein